MCIYYCSTRCLLSAAIVSEAVYGYGPIFMQLFLTFCQRLSPKMSYLYHISSVRYIGMSLPLRKVYFMKKAKVNAYIMHIFGKNGLLSIHAT